MALKAGWITTDTEDKDAICKIENEKPKIIKTVEKDPLEDLTEDNAFEKLKEMFGL